MSIEAMIRQPGMTHHVIMSEGADFWRLRNPNYVTTASVCSQGFLSHFVRSDIPCMNTTPIDNFNDIQSVSTIKFYAHPVTVT